MKKKAIIVITVFLCLGILATLYVHFYPCAKATSEDGNWKAYLIGTADKGAIDDPPMPIGDNLLEGYPKGVLTYEGNDEAVAENVEISVSAIDSRGETHSYEGEEGEHVSSNNSYDMRLIDRILLKRPNFYWFMNLDTIGLYFIDVDKVQITVSWNEEGKQKTQTLNLDVKAERERCIPLFGI